MVCTPKCLKFRQAAGGPSPFRLRHSARARKDFGFPGQSLQNRKIDCFGGSAQFRTSGPQLQPFNKIIDAIERWRAVAPIEKIEPGKSTVLDPVDLFISEAGLAPLRSEEHTSELQSLMRNPYSVFCL